MNSKRIAVGLGLGVAVAVLAAPTLRGRSTDPIADAPAKAGPPEVEVITDAAIVASFVRDHPRARPGDAHFDARDLLYDVEKRKAALADPNVLARLESDLATPEPDQRVVPALLLAAAGRPGPLDALIAGPLTPIQARTVIVYAGTLDELVPSPSLTQWLRRREADPTDDHTASLAFDRLARWKIDGWRPLALARLKSGRDEGCRAARALAEDAPTEDDWKAFVATQSTTDDTWRMVALAAFARATTLSPQTRRTALDQAMKLAVASQSYGTGTMEVLEAIETLPPEQQIAPLELLAKKAAAPPVGLRAGEMLIVADRPNAIARAKKLAATNAHGAADALAKVFAGTNDAVALATLEDISKSQGDELDLVEEIVDAMVAIAGREKAKPHVDRIVARMDAHDRAVITARVAPSPLPVVAKRLVEAGVFPQVEADAALAKLAKEDPGDADLTPVVALLSSAGRHLWFDVETGEFPNRHDELLYDFAAASAGRLRIDAAHETWTGKDYDDESGVYRVEFASNGRLYRVTAQNHGDWYDVAAVLVALHRALEDTGVPDRFVGVQTGDQTAQFLFAPPAAIGLVAREFVIPLELDPGAGRETGKAFERQVIEQLQREGTVPLDD